MSMLHDIIPTARSGAGKLQFLLRELRSLLSIAGLHFNRLRQRLMAGNRRRRAEHELESLPNAILRDIGIVRSNIAWIAARPSEQWRGGRDGPA